MSGEDLQELLEVSERIAKAVEAYPPEVRTQAYEDLMRAYHGGERPTRSTDAPPPAVDVENAPAPAKPAKAAKATKATKKATPAKRGRSKAPEVSALRNYDFWPDDKQTFPAFVEEKKPRTLQEKNLVAVYWLEQIAAEPEITTSHVLAAFKAAKWKEATDPVNALQVTASLKSWIDTSDMSKLSTARPGRIYVEHEMPSNK